MSYVVTELYVYPIKSLAGVAIQTGRVEEMGFENDRRWMLIDSNNDLITQREYPKLSQFYPEIKEGNINISHYDKRHIFSIDECLNEPIFSKVWDDDTKVFEVNIATSKWFSEQLGFACKLVKIQNLGDRKHIVTSLNQTLNVSLADGYPYLLVGTKSLDFLNEKLSQKITIHRFRPNIVIETQIPHEEDNFVKFTINEVEFKNMKPCKRCIMVNNNPLNGEIKKEPLKTLSTYRNFQNSVWFATDVVSLNSGEIKVGDVLTLKN